MWLLLLVVVCSLAPCCRGGYIMPWLCLERCNETSSTIAQSLQQLQQLRGCVTKASFELYNLGPNGQLIVNTNLTQVGPVIRSYNIQTFPMISSYPYPPQFLSWMRQLWQQPQVGQKFIASLAREAQLNGWTGYQVDFEPTSNATVQDGLDYASFLGLMSRQLHPVQVVPTVASWSPIWNFSAIAQSGVSRVLTMTTYAKSVDSFKSHLQYALNNIPLPLLGVGVETWPEMDDGFDQRVQICLQDKIDEIDIWKSPIPDNWIPSVKKFCGMH